RLRVRDDHRADPVPRLAALGQLNMDLGNNILSILIWLPIIGGIAVLVFGDEGDARSSRAGGMRILALGVSLLTFLLSIFLYRNFDTAVATMQFVERVPWIEALSVE